MTRASLALGAVLLAACQAAPVTETIKVTASAEPVQPILVPMVADADPNAPRVNQWGGEVPEAAPSGRIIEGTVPPLKDS